VSDTQLQLGVVQDFPRATKRRLRGALEVREAEQLDAQAQLARRSIVRDASLAWIELWRYAQEAALTRSTLREADAQMQLAEIALRAGTTSQAEFLSARQDVGRLQDAETGAEQSIAHARTRLSRWIGEAASREVQAELPPLPPLPPLNEALARVARHPVLAASQADVASAQTRLALAQAAYQPDWRVELGYANRPEYADLVTVKVGIDLPFFTGKRQDRDVAAAAAQEDAAESLVADARRQLESEARLNHHDFERLIERLASYDGTLLPQGDARITAASAGWRSGRGQFRDVLDARRALLEVRVMRLDLERDLLQHWVQLTYLGVFDAPEGRGGQP
jgi:outer membrane protein TolC